MTSAKPASDFSLFGRDLFGDPVKPRAAAGPLSQAFTLPPFSVLDARSGPWQERKRAWLALGIKSEIGRAVKGSNAIGEDRGKPEIADSRKRIMDAGDGITFDPVICELAYQWFAPPSGLILDPFAGGSVRGVVASMLGFRYTGIELRAEQVVANRAQGAALCDGAPKWIEGDSRNAASLAPEPADFLFSCPPYGDLERYSDNPLDLSTLDYSAFVKAYREVVAASVAMLKPNRFAAFVVGEFRDDRGHYRGFVNDTIAAFEAAGLRYYNEAIYIMATGSLGLRTGYFFPKGRKLGKQHQNLLVFVKGDWKKAAEACANEAG